MSNLAPRRGIKHLAQSITLGWQTANASRPVRATAFLAALCAMLLAACINEVDAPTSERGSFSLGLQTYDLQMEVVTRAARELTSSEAATYLVTLTDAEDLPLWAEKPFAEITLADRTQPLATGYKVTAESITASQAETLNNGFGERRYAGSSIPFAIVSGSTTHVTVPCSLVNTGLCVTFDDTFTSFFTEYAVTTDDTRALKFNATNATPANIAEDFPTSAAIAFYNIPDGAKSFSLPIIISASAGWDGTVRLQRNLTLQPGKITRLAVKLNAPEPTTGNISLLAITYDDTFTEGTTTEITLE